MTKRPGDAFIGTPSKQTAGERSDSHSVVSETIGDTSSTGNDMETSSTRTHRSQPELRDFQRAREPTHNLLRTYSSHMTGPKPCHTDISVEFPLTRIVEYAKIVRNSILNVLYPDGDYLVDGVCSEEDWIIVIKYILKSRIDLVYSSYTGRRPTDRVPPVRIQMPRSIAMLINGIGVHAILRGNCQVYPSPSAPPTDAAMRIGNLATHNRLVSFSNLITAATQRGVIHTDIISTAPEGTGWWLLRAATTVDRTVLATTTTSSVTVWAQFDDWTPSDGLLAAIAAIGYSGHVLDDWTLYSYMLESMTDVNGIRVDFATNA